MSDLDNIDGLFVGMLSDDEMELFECAVTNGKATRVYEGAAGFLGLAKVKVIRRSQP